MVCGTCSASCYTCSDAASCDSCYFGTNRYIDGSSLCVCLSRYYLPNALTTASAAKQVCKPCHYSCLSCSSGSTVCTSCNASAFRVSAPVSGGCPCDQHYFDNGIAELCLDCPDNCATCYGLGAGSCLTCDTATYFLAGSCYLDCPNYYYNDDVLWQCGTCPSHCLHCTNSTYCLTC